MDINSRLTWVCRILLIFCESNKYKYVLISIEYLLDCLILITIKFVMMKNLLFKLLFLSLIGASMAWQGCDPPPTPPCNFDYLFSGSSSVTYNSTNNSLALRATEPMTCAEEVVYAFACNYVYLNLIFEFEDCSGNIVESVSQQIKYENTDFGSWELNWEIDKTPANITVANDGTVIYSIPTPNVSVPYKHLNLRYNCSVTQDVACELPSASFAPTIGLSLNFGLVNEDDATLILDDVGVYNGGYFGPIPLFTTDEDC